MPPVSTDLEVKDMGWDLVCITLLYIMLVTVCQNLFEFTHRDVINDSLSRDQRLRDHVVGVSMIGMCVTHVGNRTGVTARASTGHVMYRCRYMMICCRDSHTHSLSQAVSLTFPGLEGDKFSCI